MFRNLFLAFAVMAMPPLAQAALARQRPYPGQTLPRVYDTLFGDVMVDEVYIYPSPLPAATS